MNILSCRGNCECNLKWRFILICVYFEYINGNLCGLLLLLFALWQSFSFCVLQLFSQFYAYSFTCLVGILKSFRWHSFTCLVPIFVAKFCMVLAGFQSFCCLPPQFTGAKFGLKELPMYYVLGRLRGSDNVEMSPLLSLIRSSLYVTTDCWLLFMGRQIICCLYEHHHLSCHVVIPGLRFTKMFSMPSSLLI